MKFRKYFTLFIIVIGFSLGIRFFLFELYVVSTQEMEPTLYKNSLVLVQKFPFFFKKSLRGKVVLLQVPHTKQLVFRRVIGLPEDRVYYSKNKLILNNQVQPSHLSEKWNSFKNKTKWMRFTEELSRSYYDVFLRKNSTMSFGPYKVPKEHYFVMGDHRSLSRDSRNWPRHLRQAKGYVRFYRKNPLTQNKILISKGTQLKIQKDPVFPILFITKRDVFLEGQSLDVDVEALNGGVRGNIPRNQELQVLGTSSLFVKAQSATDFKNGRDTTFVPIKNIQGKALLIFWTCDSTSRLLRYLCPIEAFKKGQWFQLVHNGNPSLSL